jgi:hypothetical protein
MDISESVLQNIVKQTVNVGTEMREKFQDIGLFPFLFAYLIYFVYLCSEISA